MNGATTPPSSSAIRPRRSSDWDEFRPIIERLYRNNQLKLKDVKEIMERDYNFVASEKQFKDRLAVWHVRKNIKASERDIMLRKQQKRAARGKQTAFRVSGHTVDSKRISRFARRYSSALDGPQGDSKLSRAGRVSSPEPDTPSDMSCYTPEPEDRSSETLSPATDLQSDSQDDKLPVTADTETDDGKSASEPLSPAPLPTQHAANPATTGYHDSDPIAQLSHFEEEMSKHIRQMDERLAALRGDQKR